MRYIRKVTALILSIIFCVALVVGVGIIYAVKNVNVTYIDYSGNNAEEYAATRENLNKLKGTQMLFLGLDEIEERLGDKSLIAVESFEKIYPCTVNIVLRERMECFYTRQGTEYDIYDDRGNVIKTVQSAEVPLNTLDSSPNILIEADDELIVPIAKLCEYFKEQFGALRSLVESVYVDSAMENIVIIKLRSGMRIAVSDWQENGAEKMGNAYREYLQLSDSERVDGLITIAA